VEVQIANACFKTGDPPCCLDRADRPSHTIAPERRRLGSAAMSTSWCAGVWTDSGASAPNYTGQGIIDPLAGICAMQMMLATRGEDKAAAAVEEAVIYVTSKKL
jgi:hypothetical protein